jgi:hypothetical protein
MQNRIRVILHKQGEDKYGDPVWTCGKFHIIRKRWELPYVHTDYRLTDASTGKNHGDFETLRDIRDYIAEVRLDS